jgi:hypothetical protein
MSTVTQLPERILNKTAEVMLLGDILKDFEPDRFEKANSKYRKPSYQRGITKCKDWNQSLVCSILEGKAIGGIVMSKWSRAVMDENNNPSYIEYYNIEDGGTRLGALKKFYDGDFETEYGDINKEDVKKCFLDYRVAVELLEKERTTPPLRDSIYFEELCNNFSLLQEGTPLTASDRYAANVADTEFNFTGSPIVNFTIEQIGSYDHYKSCFGLSDVGPRGANRKKLATSVAVVSGMTFGPKFANTQYFLHVPILSRELSEEEKTKFAIVKQLIIQTIANIETVLPKWSNERFTGYFTNCAKFTGSMIADIYDEFPNEIVQDDDFKTFACEFNKRWTSIVNQWRGMVQSDRTRADEWLETDVYKHLDTANKRNCLEVNLRQRMLAVRSWYLSDGH